MSHLPRLLPLLLLLLLAGTTPAQIRKDPLPSEAELARYGLVRAWWNRAVIDPGSDKVAAITADEHAVYVQSTVGVVTAMDAETGKVMWSRLVGTPTQLAYPAVTNDELVLITAGMSLHAIHKASGEEMWELDLPHHPSASPAVDEDQVYLGMIDGSVYAYDLREITRLYQERLLPQYRHQARKWRYVAPTEIVSPPVSNGEAVVFASFSGLLFSVTANVDDRGRAKTNFQFETEGRAPIRVPVAHNEGTIFVASDDARVFALDMLNGSRRWSFTAGAPVRKSPRVMGSNVFVSPSRRGTYCLRTSTGFEQWHQREAIDVLAATPDLVYASNDVGDVLLLNRADGSIVGTLPYKHLSTRMHNERTDRLYLATDGGLVVCIREKARELPQWHRFPERQPIRPLLAPDEPVETPEGQTAPAVDDNTVAP